MITRLLVVPGVVLGIIFGFVGKAVAADHAVILMYHRFGEDSFPSTNVRLT